MATYKIIIKGNPYDLNPDYKGDPTLLWLSIEFTSGDFPLNIFWSLDELKQNISSTTIVIDETGSYSNLVQSGSTLVTCYSFQAYNSTRTASRSFRMTRLDYSALKLEFPNQVDSPFNTEQCDPTTETDNIQVARDFLSGVITPPPTTTPPTEPTPTPTPITQCVVFTASADNGTNRFFQTTKADYDQLKIQFPNNIGIYETVDNCDARQDPIIVIDYLQTATPPSPPPPSNNYLVIISTQCGNLRAVFNQNNYDSWVSTNNTNTLCKIDPRLPCSLTYSLSGKVFEPDNWSSISQEIAVCYQATIPPTPLPNPTKGGSLTGITMLLLALGIITGGKFGK